MNVVIAPMRSVTELSAPRRSAVGRRRVDRRGIRLDRDEDRIGGPVLGPHAVTDVTGVRAAIELCLGRGDS